MKPSYLLSIDQGTTGTTVSLFNTKGQLKVSHNQEFRQIFPQPGWVEHNPNDIWRSTLTCLKAVFSKAKIKSQSIISIGITNQRETVVAWNRETGEAVGNAIVWQCRRTTEACDWLKKSGYEKKIKSITGLVIDPYFSASKMQWFLKNNFEAKDLGRRGLLCFGTIDSFLMWKLSGGEIFATDVSNASRTMLMDLSTLQYHPDLLKLFDLKPEMLPEIRPSGTLFGATDKVGPLEAGIPITGAIGDQQSALFGQHCFALGEAKITFGTGSFVLMNTKNRRIFSDQGLLTTVAWQIHDGNAVDYALEGGAFICGAAVQWIRDNLGFIKNSKDIERLANKVPDCGGIQFVPAFAGLGAPFWDPKVRGSFLGLTRGTTREHIARATLEAMALQNYDVVNTMVKDSRISLKKVRVDGGASSNNLLMQMQANFLGVEVLRPKMVESTSLGAALMAGMGAGVWTNVDDIRKIDRVDKLFTSQMSVRDRDLRTKEWYKAITALRTYHGA